MVGPDCQVYELAPKAVNVTCAPAQIKVEEADVLIVGLDLATIVIVFIPEQIVLDPMTV